MFIENKYKKWYDNIIKNAQLRLENSGYTETHHIIPKCMGGDNLTTNLIVLTAREHFLCHILLTKFTIGKSRHKLVYAANMMCQVSRNYQHRYVNARLYEMIKNEFSLTHSKQLSGRKLSEDHKRKISAGGQGRKVSKETIEKRRKSCTGLKRSIEQKERMRQSQLNRKKKTPGEQALISENISKNRKGKGTAPKSKDHKRKLSLYFKGRKTGPRSEEIKIKMRGPKSDDHKASISAGRKGKKMFNNGKESVLCFPGQEPQGFILGRLKK